MINNFIYIHFSSVILNLSLPVFFFIFSICLFNPRLTKLFFVTRLTRGVVTIPSLDFPNRTPYDIDFGVNR